MDALAQKFAATHDIKLKDEIERMAKKYGRLRRLRIYRGIKLEPREEIPTAQLRTIGDDLCCVSYYTCVDFRGLA